MCPLRFILVLFSAALAGYYVWSTVPTSEGPPMLSGDSSRPQSTSSSKDKEEQLNLNGMVGDGFWVFVDMASGRYLWRNLKELNKSKN